VELSYGIGSNLRRLYRCIALAHHISALRRC